MVTMIIKGVCGEVSKKAEKDSCIKACAVFFFS